MSSQDLCALCREEKRDPEYLECAHSYCRTCLEDFRSYRSQRWSKYCPLCRNPIEYEQGNGEEEEEDEEPSVSTGDYFDTLDNCNPNTVVISDDDDDGDDDDDEVDEEIEFDREMVYWPPEEEDYYYYTDDSTEYREENENSNVGGNN